MKLLPVALALGLLAGPALAQDQPAGPPPLPGRGDRAGELELLPEIGRIGARAFVSAGPSWNPYGVGQGFHVGGGIDLPLFHAPGGKVSYSLLVDLGLGTGDPFVITDSVAYVANLAAGASPAAALAGPPGAPFPVRRAVRTRLRLLQVSPFGLKYSLQRGGSRLRPYLGAGLDVDVVISSQDPERDESLAFTGSAPFDAPLIGGQIAQAPELTALGLPTGQGNLELGFHAGAGLEVRVSPGVSLALDYRFSGIGSEPARLHTVSAALGFHF
jgi:hypothetical protein